MFAFTFPEILLMIMLCCIVYPAGLPNFVSFVLFFCFTSEHWLPTIERDSAANIRIASTPRSNGDHHHTHIEIGGSQHSDDWKTDLDRSCGQGLRTQSVIYNLKAFKVDFLWHCRSRTALDSLREVVDMLSPPHSAGGIAASRTPGLELNVEVVKSSSVLDIDDAVDQPSVDLYRLSNLQKFIWKGSYPHFLFARPQYRTFWDMMFDRTTEVKFPRLAELCLVDCDLKPGDLVEILKRCPALTVCEVQQLGYKFKPDSTILSPESDHDETDEFVQYGADTSDIVPHRTLKHLKISSALDIRDFFSTVHMLNLQSLSLHISRWTPLPCSIQDYIPLLQIEWAPLTYFELTAPLNYYSLYFLKAFFDHRPSLRSRTHILVDDRTL